MEEKKVVNVSSESLSVQLKKVAEVCQKLNYIYEKEDSELNNNSVFLQPKEEPLKKGKFFVRNK